MLAVPVTNSARATPEPVRRPGRGENDRHHNPYLPAAAPQFYDLLNALKRQAEEVGGVPDAQAEVVDKAADSVGGGCRRFRADLREANPRAATSAHGGERVARQSDVVDELGAVGVRDPEGEGLANTPPRLDEAATVAVTPRHRRDPGDPGTGLVALEHDTVGHRSHFVPRQGSRSRSIARSVPGGRSAPRWTGTVVWQRPHRIRTCDPF